MTDMDNAQAAADAALARVDAQVAEAEARRAGIELLADEVTALTAVERSPQGEVTVEAQSGGRVLSVAVSDRALQLSPQRLSQLLTETVSAAQRSAALAAVARSAMVLGEDSPLVGQLRAEAAATFPASNEIG